MKKPYAEISNKKGEIEFNTQKIDEHLISAAQNLVNKLQEMYKHPDFQATFVLASLYQNPYKGPSAISEMLTLKQELEKYKHSGQKA